MTNIGLICQNYLFITCKRKIRPMFEREHSLPNWNNPSYVTEEEKLF